MDKFFLQSFSWEKFQQNFHQKTFRIEGVLLIKHHLPLGKCWLYCPRPKNLSGMFFRKVKTLANKENAVFLKIDAEDELKPLKSVKLTKSAPIQPPSTLILNLEKPEKDLLSDMKQKTRYNIKLAEKHKVKIFSMNNTKGGDIFFNLANITSKRQGIKFHSKLYYQKMIDTLKGEGMVDLLIAEYQGKPVAANIILYYNRIAYYLHGASCDKHKKVMAPYLLQWKAMQKAKRKGMKKYDFWGIIPSEKPNGQDAKYRGWEGITRFKKGFGGYEVNYPETIDVIFQPGWYWVYKIMKSNPLADGRRTKSKR